MAENIINILAKSQKDTQGLLKSSKGGKKESIYKSSIFEGLSKDDKRNKRQEIRGYVQNIFKSILNTKDKETITKLSKSFADFYKLVYIVNDYTLSSVASNNTDEETKKTINNALNIIRKELNIK